MPEEPAIAVEHYPPLPRIYQDEFLVVIDKPAGMLVHPTSGGEGAEWVVMKRLRDELGQKVYPVHRLDRPTTGVLVLALNKKVAAVAQQAFEQRKVEKVYQAAVGGCAPEAWRCDEPLAADGDAEPLPAVTLFRRLAVTERGWFPADAALVLSLLEARPETGRFHQIRRHLCASGYPIVGDFRYAGQEHSFRLGETLGTGTRMLLHAKALYMPHPHSGEVLHIVAPDPPEFGRCFPMWAGSGEVLA